MSTPGPADHRQRSVFARPVGVLCCKIARRLAQQDRDAILAGRPAKHRQRCAQLLMYGPKKL